MLYKNFEVMFQTKMVVRQDQFFNLFPTARYFVHKNNKAIWVLDCRKFVSVSVLDDNKTFLVEYLDPAVLGKESIVIM